MNGHFYFVVRYRWAYAVPALAILVLTAIIALATFIFMLMGRASMSRMRQYLNKTSQGWILTTYVYGRRGEPFAPAPSIRTPDSTRRWVENVGKNPITVAEGANGTLIVDVPEAVQAQPLLMMPKGTAAIHEHDMIYTEHFNTIPRLSVRKSAAFSNLTTGACGNRMQLL